MRQELELYFHIPFCVRKCAYCDFLSASGTAREQEDYVQAVLREIRGYQFLAGQYEVKTVFLGGGTPSLLDCGQISRMFKAMREVFFIAEDAEITVEANPGTVGPEKLECYQRLGVNRLSIGLQSVHNAELELLGRIHTFEDFLQTWNQARKAGFTNLNIDLISALPGQRIESWQDTLQRTMELNPEHISAYSLILEEGTRFYEWSSEGRFAQGAKLALPSEEEEYQMGEMTVEMLEAAGYHRYEVSNYARPGKECRHNLGYWERRDYLGIGAGAASLLSDIRYSHIPDREEYVRRMEAVPEGRQAGEIVSEREELTEQEQMEEFMFLGLRKTAGISQKTFWEYFGKGLTEVYGPIIEELGQEGLLEQQGDMLRLTRRGMDISNYVLAQFLFS